MSGKQGSRIDNYIIRAYKPTDKERLRFICKETAFDEYKKDPQKLESVPIMFCDYFTECEPEYIFMIADENNIAQGYIICAADYEKFTSKMKGEYTNRLLSVAPEETAFLNTFLLALEKIKDKSVHFHIDMLPECRRKGLGTMLINTLCSKLKSDGFNHISVCCVSRNAASYALCKKLGFGEIYDYGNNIVALSKKL